MAAVGTAQAVIAIVTGVLAALCFVIAGFQYRQKGPIFTNAYLLASPAEREKLDKKAEYRLACIVFVVMGVALALLTLQVLAGLGWLLAVVLLLMGLLIAYVIVQEVKSGTYR